MEKNYYFVIGERNASTAEIIRILDQKKIPYCLCGKDDVYEPLPKECQGRQVVYIGMPQMSGKGNICFNYPYVETHKAPLRNVADSSMLGVLNETHIPLMIYNAGNNIYNKCGEIQELLNTGYNSDIIKQIQLADRLARDVNEEIENQAEQQAQEFASMQKLHDLLVFRLDTSLNFSETEWYSQHENLLAVTDRAVWLQKYQNVLILDNHYIAYAGILSLDLEEICNGGKKIMLAGIKLLAGETSEEIREKVIDFASYDTAKMVKNGVLL